MTATGNDFGQTVRSEWTKLRSGRSVGGLLLALGLAVALSLLAASQTSTRSSGPLYVDEFHFVHQSMTGDGTVTARVLRQQPSHEWAKAGIMIKERAASGASYVALMMTPEHGVRLQADFTVDRAGSASPSPRWLRIVRHGATITGHESPDGVTWTEVGTVRMTSLPSTVEVGLFVSSPANIVTTRDGVNTSQDPVPTTGTATFDNVSVTRAGPAPPGSWQSDDVGQTGRGSAAETEGVFTVTGSGDIASVRPAGNDDIVRTSLTGLQIAVLAMVVFGVAFTSSEYRQGLARTTFAASPQRGRVLAAKAVIMGTTACAAGLAASVAAFVLSQPILHRNGYVPPAYPYLSLLDPPVLRAVVGSALFLAAVALAGLGAGVIIRHTAGAVATVVGVVLVPQLVAGPLGEDVGLWVNRLTPAAGLAVQQTRGEALIDPWLGLGVAFGYAAIALAAGYLALRQRDV
jgi:hypothetical protein